MIVYKKRANIFFIKIVIVSFLFIVISVVFWYIGQCFFGERPSEIVQSEVSKFTIVIDAGHGGIDGGAQVGGVFEKDLNLSLSKKIYDCLSLYNVECIMTRDSDVLLADESSSHKKQSDLLNRVKAVNGFINPIFISVHMNKFPESKYSGLQVFYSMNNTDSKMLAEMIQTNVVSTLQGFNNRKIKSAGSSIFVLDRLDCPAVLVECGFMSNGIELALLCDGGYQSKLAFVIASSIIDFIS